MIEGGGVGVGASWSRFGGGTRVGVTSEAGRDVLERRTHFEASSGLRWKGSARENQTPDCTTGGNKDAPRREGRPSL